jgi:NAD(P)-dependent dehydrogenase (short-subunit alcohol dehydrogenase family)
VKFLKGVLAVLTDDFTGKTLVLTGASSGLGQVIAQALAERGASLLLTGRNSDALEALAESLPGSGHRQLSLDLHKSTDIEAALSSALTAPIYGFCHCAGSVQTRPLKLSRPAPCLEQMQINALAGIEVARVLTQKQWMPDQGSVLFISSIYSQVGAPGQIAYCASKGALLAASKAMAVELAPRQIRVNCLAPGFVATAMTLQSAKLTEAQLNAIKDKHPLGTGTPEQVARAAVFLLSPDNHWITGTELCIDGGYTAQ